MYVTYSELFQFVIMLVALVTLCYMVFHKDNDTKK